MEVVPLSALLNAATGTWFWLRRNTPDVMCVSLGALTGSRSEYRSTWTSSIALRSLVSNVNSGRDRPLYLLVRLEAMTIVVFQPPPGHALVLGIAGVSWSVQVWSWM